jgi:hypothetical protein
MIAMDLNFEFLTGRPPIPAVAENRENVSMFDASATNEQSRADWALLSLLPILLIRLRKIMPQSFQGGTEEGEGFKCICVFLSKDVKVTQSKPRGLCCFSTFTAPRQAKISRPGCHHKYTTTTFSIDSHKTCRISFSLNVSLSGLPRTV